MTTTTAPPATSGEIQRRYHRIVRDSGYLLLSFPWSIIGFILFVTVITVGPVTLPVFLLGLPVLALGLTAAQALGDVERRRLVELGKALPPVPPYRGPRAGLQGIRARLSHVQGWLDLLFQLLYFPIAILSFVVTLTWWLVGVAALTYPTYAWLLPEHSQGIGELLGFQVPVFDHAVTVLGGALMLISAPWVVRALVQLHYAWAHLTLAGTSGRALQDRVDSLTESRAAVVGAEADMLRRIERDIHDGPQQRLVRLSMDLQTAQRRLADGDDSATRELLTESLEHVQGSLAELRSLSRGIAPPILTDRGLGAAVVSAAGQSPLPVETRISLPAGRRLGAARESAAYFVVTEALTNAAKHSGATRVLVAIAEDDDGALQVAVRDDGVGGAHLGKGHGLAGLRDRLAGVDGRLAVDSPPGQGTVVTARIP